MSGTIKNIVSALLFFIAASVLAYAAPPRIAVADFTVTSDNPKLKYVGKGLAEMVAAELQASKGVLLIDRDKREAALGELEFSLSGMADTQSQVDAGKLLAADFLLFGEIIDMDSAILVSCKIVKVETGEVAWTDKNLGPLANYDTLSRKMASSALKGLGADKAAAVAAAAPTKPVSTVSEARKIEAIVAFSSAVNAMDKKDDAEAKRQIQLAAAIDTSNPAVAAYLAKLVTNTTKFKVLLEPLYSYSNPAFLGIIRQDMLFLAGSMPAYPIFTSPPTEGLNFITISGDKKISESVIGPRLGYAIPIGKAMGLMVEFMPGGYDDRAGTGTGANFGYTSGGVSARSYFGGMLDMGFALTPSFSVGVGGGYILHSKKDSNPTAALTSNAGGVYSVNAGFLLRNADESLIFDSRAGFSNETTSDIDPSTFINTGTESPVPVYVENTLTTAFDQKRSFFILKQIDNISYDKAHYFATLMPSFERFLGQNFSLRAGVEGSLLYDAGKVTPGYGGLGGMTLRFPSIGLDIDLNATYRMRPSRILSGVLYPDFLILMNASWSGVFKKSR